jgi:chitin disaccharide deacetylase
VEERAVLGREILPTLVDETGRFPRTSGEFFRRTFLGRISWDEVEREIAAQIARFQKTGLRLSHLDSHQHLHMFPPVFQIVRRLTQGMDNVWIRNSAGPWRKSPRVLMGRWIRQLGLNLTCLSARGLHGPPLQQMPDGLFGFEVSGCLTRSALEQILRKIPDGLYELICHPGEGEADTRRRYSHWGYRWAEELEALTASETRRLLQEQKIALTSFAQAQQTGPR